METRFRSEKRENSSPATSEKAPAYPSDFSAQRAVLQVMDVVAKADALQRAGRKIYHLEVGQPQSSAPAVAIETAQAALGGDRCGYYEPPQPMRPESD